MNRSKQTYYDILDINLNANPEVIRMAYIRAKNAYNRDSLAAYSLFDSDETKQILDEIEEAYTILSDADKRHKYDESHGFLSSESTYNSYKAEVEKKSQEEEKPREQKNIEVRIATPSKAFTVDPEIEEKIRSTENITGAFLKMVREYKQTSQEEIMDALKISKNYLLALESDDFSKLPATVFVRGFVIQYAKALKLDHEKTASNYMRFLKANRPA